jgi:threonine aldolase
VVTANEKNRLLKKGAMFFDWHTPHSYRGNLAAGEGICRFVTSFATTADDVDAFGDLIA